MNDFTEYRELDTVEARVYGVSQGIPGVMSPLEA